MGEKWVKIDEYPEYEASDNGNIRRIGSDSYIKPVPNSSGYATVTLMRDGQKHTKYVHDIVGRLFCSGYKPGLSVNHRDRNRLNNVVSNLEWIALEDNKGHGKITKEKASIILRAAKRGWKPQQIAKAFGLRVGVVETVIRNGV